MKNIIYTLFLVTAVFSSSVSSSVFSSAQDRSGGRTTPWKEDFNLRLSEVDKTEEPISDEEPVSDEEFISDYRVQDALDNRESTAQSVSESLADLSELFFDIEEKDGIEVFIFSDKAMEKIVISQKDVVKCYDSDGLIHLDIQPLMELSRYLERTKLLLRRGAKKRMFCKELLNLKNIIRKFEEKQNIAERMLRRSSYFQKKVTAAEQFFIEKEQSERDVAELCEELRKAEEAKKRNVSILEGPLGAVLSDTIIGRTIRSYM